MTQTPATIAPSGLGRLFRKNAGIILMIVGVVAAIELGARTGAFGSHVLVPSLDMVRGMVEIVSTPEGWQQSILPTVVASSLATAFAAVIGIATGVLLWWSAALRRVCEPYLVVLPAVPVFALYPMFIVVFGQSNIALILTGILLGVVPMMTQALAGMDSMSSYIDRLSRVYRLSWVQRLRMLFLPGMSSSLMTGLRLCAAYSMVGVVASELVLSGSGLGHLIHVSYERFDLEGMYGAILLVLLGIAMIFQFIGLLERRMIPRGGGES